MKERRRHPRITLRKPILASINTTPVFVLDASRGGLRVAHRAQLPPPGGICRVEFPLENDQVRLDCAVVRTAIQHASEAAEALFNSGLRIVGGDEAAEEKLNKFLDNGSSRRVKRP